ncbi:PREDICTED: probable LRR receptor-like serine/threonine-protein kinase At1g63430 [Tarenaya hassleriana]|uniref:probable LRR receptor-like serine/threonine-protein kinase At1g63430 n=1 Tax=Tarenaya hassleriana TaxID=28532 RepID=UPI00053C4533|nr:PREDICTED: probable LRR receptor-like serine/threonine-protein kinase At1g63430 [Tarenaya hassleriana]
MRSCCSSLLQLCVVLGFLFISCESFPSSEVEALKRFKESIYDDPLLVMTNWNAPNSSPCDWTGISCSPFRDHVIKINISASSIKGFLAPELSQITYLQELILHRNILMGTIPKEIGNLKNLKVLDLGNNQLTGPIPAELGNLSSIMIINLQSNGLTGKLPPDFGNMKYLRELHLDRNRLQGSLPVTGTSHYSSRMVASSSNVTGLCKSSTLKVADFSYNFFVGSIPKCLEYLPITSFQGNCLQNKDPKQRPPTQCGGAPLVKTRQSPSPTLKHRPAETESKHHKASRPSWLLALEIVTGSMVGIFLLVAVFSAIHRCNNRSSLIIPWKKSASEKEKFTVYTDSEMLKDVRRFTRQELEVACEDFSNIIGSSADSQVYKGTIKGGMEIAVISLCIKEEDWTGYLELYFQREVSDLARLNHENAGKLLGYCKESTPFTRMLVFEYASNGTLYEHLHCGEGSLLSWARRMKIVIGIARGLKYLHTELNPPFTISELNSNAVYLTEDFTPKLVDFECWKTILARSEKNSRNISSQGAICVLPNAMERRYLDVQGNIYAFGVLLLEIVSGRPPYCKDKGCLVEWAKEFIEVPDVMGNLVDPELKHFKQEELKAICEVTSQCINPDQDKPLPPSMQDFCEMLESRISLSISAELRSSSLAWAELALAS